MLFLYHPRCLPSLFLKASYEGYPKISLSSLFYSPTVLTVPNFFPEIYCKSLLLQCKPIVLLSSVARRTAFFPSSLWQPSKYWQTDIMSFPPLELLFFKQAYFLQPASCCSLSNLFILFVVYFWMLSSFSKMQYTKWDIGIQLRPN